MSLKWKRICLISLFVCLGATASAFSYGITVGTWNPGSRVYLGTSIGLTQHIEAELFTTAQVTPIPFDSISGGAAITASLMAPREFRSGEASLYANAYLSAGYLHGTDSRGVFLRITPLAAGGPYYGMRERGVSAGLLYDPWNTEFSFFINLFLLDFYL